MGIGRSHPAEDKSSSSSSSAPSSTSSKSASSSRPISVSSAKVSRLRAALFTPATTLGIGSFAQLPDDMLQWTGAYFENLEDKEQSLVKLAQTSKSVYQALYPSIKAALLKILKKAVEQDNTVKARELLLCQPYLQLRTDAGDPAGLAYKDIATTPYQDALADPMAEEMRGVLEEGFPGETKEEKLAHAALQSNEFNDPRFGALREEKRHWMGLTRKAYTTYKSRDQAWENSGYAAIHIQPLRDAWTRVSLVQRLWPRRLQKIYSVVNMDEKQAFKGLPVDLPEPHFGRNRSDPWNLDLSGCNLQLLTVSAERDLAAGDFHAVLARVSDDYPVLIRQGEGETATYHLYAPHISLEQDESEWQCVHINVPRIHKLIGESIDFRQPQLPYSPLFGELYKFGCDRNLYLGAGFPHFFAAHNLSGSSGGSMMRAAWVGSRWRRDGIQANFIAIQTLFKMRAERLATRCIELEAYLPCKKSMGLSR